MSIYKCESEHTHTLTHQHTHTYLASVSTKVITSLKPTARKRREFRGKRGNGCTGTAKAREFNVLRQANLASTQVGKNTNCKRPPRVMAIKDETVKTKVTSHVRVKRSCFTFWVAGVGLYSSVCIGGFSV